MLKGALKPGCAKAVGVLILWFSFSGCDLLAGNGASPKDIEVAGPTKRDDEFTRMIEGLSIDTTWTPPVDKNGADLPDNFNPLGLGAPGSHRAVRPLHEIYTQWVVYNDGGRVEFYLDFVPEYIEEVGEFFRLKNYTTKHYSILYEDLSAGWGTSRSARTLGVDDVTDMAWVKSPKKSISGDFDGDGLDEVLIVAAYLESGQIGVRMGKILDSGEYTTEVLKFNFPGGAADLQEAFPLEIKSVFLNDNAMMDDPIESITGIEITDYRTLEILQRNAYQFYRMDVAKGDIDADGADEVMLVVGGQVYLLDGGDGGASWTSEQINSYDIKTDPLALITVGCADYNQDGYCDWVVALASESQSSLDLYDIYANLAYRCPWIYGASTNATFQIYDGKTRKAFTGQNSHGDIAVPNIDKLLQSVNIVTGDFDGDGLPETAFCGRAQAGNPYREEWGVPDEALQRVNMGGVQHVEMTSFNYRLFVLDTELDENREPVFTWLPQVPEIGFVNREVNADNFIAFEILNGDAGDHWWEFEYGTSDLWVAPYFVGSEHPALVCGDMNGDGKDEIFAASAVFSVENGGIVTLFEQSYEGYTYESYYHSKLNEFFYGTAPYTIKCGNDAFYDAAVAGDVNGDGKADVVYMDWHGRLISLSINADGEFEFNTLDSPANYNDALIVNRMPWGNGMSAYSRVVNDPTTTHREIWTPTSSALAYPTLALPNIDNDSYILEYQGVEMVFTNPIVTSVISAPPYYNGIRYSVGLENVLTTYGSIDAGDHTITAASSVTLRLGGPEGEERDARDLISALFGPAKLTSSAVEFTGNIGAEVPAGENTVVYTSIPYYIYSYKLVSVPENNEDGGQGKKVTPGSMVYYKYPGLMKTYTSSVEFYNEHNGSNPDVVLTCPNTVGNPFSYPASTRVTAIRKASSVDYGLYTVTSRMLTSRSATVQTQDTTLLTNDEKKPGWNFTIPTSTIDASGATVDFTVNAKTGSNLFVSGSVPDVPYAAKDLYEWGLFMYPVVDKENGLSFYHLTYWVDLFEEEEIESEAEAGE